jgi:hypothetical protein
MGHSTSLLVAFKNVVNGVRCSRNAEQYSKSIHPANSVPQWHPIRLAGFWPSFSLSLLCTNTGRRLDVSQVNADPRMIKLEPLIMPGSLRQAAPEIPFKTRFSG